MFIRNRRYVQIHLGSDPRWYGSTLLFTLDRLDTGTQGTVSYGITFFSGTTQQIRSVPNPPGPM